MLIVLFGLLVQQMLIIVLLGLLIQPIMAEQFNNNGNINRSLVLLSTPSISDHVTYDDEEVNTLISFMVDFAWTVHDHDNVLLLADKQTMPLVDGRSPRRRLPLNALLQANIYDIRLRDMAPMGLRQLVKFTYRPSEMAEMIARQVDESMLRFLSEQMINVKREELILTGAMVVDNGFNKAIVDESVISENIDRVPEWAVMIKLFNAFKKVAFIANPFNSTHRLDDVLAFIDDQVLVIPQMPRDVRHRLEVELNKKFKDELTLIELPVPIKGQLNEGNCGLYTAILPTERFIYVPSFGNDPENWERGHSSMMDRMVLRLIAANTRKTVVPVNMPGRVCARGLSLRSLAWTLTGDAADTLVEAAKNRARFLKR